MGVSSSGPSRRTLLRSAGLAALGLAATSACAGPLTSGLLGVPLPSTTVKYWNLFGGGDGSRMRAMVADYRATYPEIDLRATTFAWGNPYYTKLSLGTLSDQPPHIAVCHLDRLVTPVGAGLLRPFEPAELEEFGITAEAFYRPAWEGSHFDGRMYAIPLDYHPMGIYYNKDICARAGLLDGDVLAPIVGPEQFVAALQAVREVTGRVAGAVPSDPASQYRLFYTLFNQAGGVLVADAGREVVLTKDVFLRVAEFLRNLSHEAGVLAKSADTASTVAAFANQQYGFFFLGGWERTTFLAADVPFGIQSFPKIFDRHVAWDGTHTFVIPNLHGGGQERIRAALHFIRGMLDRSATWVEGGHLSAWLPVGDRPETAKIVPHYENLPADGVVYDPVTWYSGSGSNLQTVVGSAIAAVMGGFLSPEQGYHRARSGLEELARTPAPH